MKRTLKEYNKELSDTFKIIKKNIWQIKNKVLSLQSQNLKTREMKSINESSVVDDTFNEIDEKLSILNKETVDWIKQKMLFHISEAYERGTKNKKQKKTSFFH